jgi:UDP-GlcNAc:undecaprenyl-phosphate/decaprenyl-phosphate GlcNAc-1-phosphate transferase
MNLSILKLAIASIGAIITALALIPAARAIGRRFGITARRGGRTDSDEPVAVFGGFAIVGAILLALAITDALPHWVALSIVALWILGAVDDARELRPYQKFAGQLTVAGMVALALPHFHLTPWFGLDLVLEVLWLVGTSNAFNLIDGIDGLAAGTGIVIALTLAAIGILHRSSRLTLAALAVAGGLGGFLVSNFPPATIFMGDAGALSVGMLLGAMALEAGALAINSRVTKYVFPLLVMLTPLLDTAIVSVTRLATGNRISRHGDDHSHHRLLSLGLSERATDFVCWSVAAVGAMLALAASMLPHPYLIALLPWFAVAMATIAIYMMDLTFESQPPGMVHGYVKGIARFILTVSYKRRVAEALIDSALIAAAYFGAYMLRHNFRIQEWELAGMIRSMPAVWFATYAAFAITGIYRGIWRYTGLSDGIRFANGAVLAGILLVAASTMLPIALSGSILVLFVILLFNLLIVTRSSFQSIRKGLMLLADADQRVLVVGTGSMGTAALGYLYAERRRGLRLVGFLDVNATDRGGDEAGNQRVLGSIVDIATVYQVSPFDRILIASDSITPESIAQLRRFAAANGIAVHRFTIRMDEIGAIGSAEPLEPSIAGALPIGAAGTRPAN